MRPVRKMIISGAGIGGLTLARALQHLKVM
jgi:2-polyprenyl-6-methoxyphenol hydroxylase-like FAD-dependent oxidoreductase